MSTKSRELVHFVDLGPTPLTILPRLTFPIFCVPRGLTIDSASAMPNSVANKLPKATADSDFYDCIGGVCASVSGSCSGGGWLNTCSYWSAVYYDAVVLAGGQVYESNQLNACICCYGTG